jgi:hypothetical protein
MNFYTLKRKKPDSAYIESRYQKMAVFRETPCKYYISFGKCSKNREACHTGYCQHCDKYYPRAKVRHINKKKQYNEKARM